MIVINCDQGSPEWYESRVGRVTASMFVEARKRLKSGPNKGDFTAAGKQYAFRLACERISGQALDEDQFETWAMKRGHELEPEARLAHELQKEILVEQAGFILDDEGIFGVSVDGLIGDDGISEYKCFISPVKLMPILLEDDLSDVMDQIQGGLWITGRKWAHFVLYCPALASIGKDLTIIEVERDETYIRELQSDLLEFNGLVESYIEKLSPRVAQVEQADNTQPEFAF